MKCFKNCLWQNKILALFSLFTLYFSLCTQSVYAIVDPISVSNNRFGIHILTDNPKDASEAALLVNSSGGDWGYITFLIESNNRDLNRWQNFFNDLRRKHLIPIVRIATKPAGSNWVRPYDQEYQAWADFLDQLVWPTKNRYVVIYNEPNHGTEWGGSSDPGSYAITLSQTIDALKAKSLDFFVLNAGLDASAPQKAPQYYDEEQFLTQMNQTVPGIFNKLDGWASHSYPNPGFKGSPSDSGRGTVETYRWELDLLKRLGLTKELPVFITETGWKHSEGLIIDKSLPDTDTVADYYKQAFNSVWKDPKIVAITPFILNYQEAPFDHFSLKKATGEKQNDKILGIQYPGYYSPYQVISDLAKIKGSPIQENKALLVKGGIYKTLVSGESYVISLTVKNVGQSIWEAHQVILKPTKGGAELGINPVEVANPVEPGQESTFNINIKAPQSGSLITELNLFNGTIEFESGRFQFASEISTPVIVKVKTALPWNHDSAGSYLFGIGGVTGTSIQNVAINSNGLSGEIDSNSLLPGYDFDFTLEKPFYQAKTIHGKVESGVNTIDFGELQPDFLSALTNPSELWKLLPFSK